MSILIEGMNKELFFRILLGARCGMFQCEGECASYYGHKVTELPPHGRLIDADKFKFDECGICDGCCETFNGNECSMCHKECRCEFMKDIDEAPTIIEAEE